MSPTFPQNTHFALIAVVSAFLLFKATKRAPKKPLLLNDLRDLASRVGTDDVPGQQLFEPEYDVIIVGGGEFAIVSVQPPND